jgi:lipopolysaccharide exporter
MALPKKAVLGAIWGIATGFGSRAVTLAATLLLTRYIAPDVYGEVSLASVIVLTANTVSLLGLGQYVIAKKTNPEVTAQATFWALIFGALAFGLVVAFREPLSALFHTPGSAEYLPWLALAAFIDRIAFIPERMLFRDMRFRTAAVARSLGETTFGIACVGFAAAGFGGTAIVMGTFARSILRMIIYIASVERRAWIGRPRFDRVQLRDFVRFGAPLTVAQLSDFGSRRWDNLLMSALFGPSVAGMYNYAYNIADIPASQIGESIGDVLVPSLVEMDAARKKAALLRAMTIVTLVVSPLALGLGAVAPTLVHAFFKPVWQPIWPMLAVLSVLSIVRPVAWIVAPYLQVYDKPQTMMILEVTKTALLLASLAALGSAFGPLAACAAPGIAFGFNALANLWVVRKMEKVGIIEMVKPLIPPVLACAPMVAAVIGVRHALATTTVSNFTTLAAEIVVGGIAFVGAALLVARTASKDFLRLMRGARTRSGRDGEPTSEPKAAAT